MNLYKHKKLYEAFDLYCRQQCDEFPTEEELAGITFSPAFEEKMQKLLRRQKYGYFVLFGTAGRRVASIVVALLLGMTVATFSVKALREPVVRFITEVFETFTSILFVDDESPASDVEMETVTPAYIPEGYTVESEITTDSVYKIVYCGADPNARLVYTQCRDESGTLTADTENTAYHSVTVNGSEGIAYKNKDNTTIMFTDGSYTYLLAGPLTEEELLRIAASVPQE